jgi:hypothetical protein
VVILLASAAFFVCGIGMIVTGKVAHRGQHRVFSTAQNDPWGYWGGIVIVLVIGIIALVAGVRALIQALDD